MKSNLSHPYCLMDLILQDHVFCIGKNISGKTIADFGCGDFRLSKFLINNNYGKIYGIDNWLAADYHKVAPNGIKFLYSSIEKSPFSDKSMDVIICTEVLEHVEKPEVLISECSRVLKNTGTLLLSVPFNFFVHGAPNDFRRYTIFGLNKLFSQHNFTIESFIPIGNTFLTILNNFVTNLGFKNMSGIKNHIRNILMIILNSIALFYYKKFYKIKQYTTLNPFDQDRTNPLGYVLSLKLKKTTDVKKSESISEPIVCPNCHGSLKYSKENISCKQCNSKYFRYDNIPVLANKEDIHIAYELK